MGGHSGGGDGVGIGTKVYIHLIRHLWRYNVILQFSKSYNNLGGGGPFLGITLSGREALVTYNYVNGEYYVHYILKVSIHGRLQQDSYGNIYDKELKRYWTIKSYPLSVETSPVEKIEGLIYQTSI